jgi:hypothetical protein
VDPCGFRRKSIKSLLNSFHHILISCIYIQGNEHKTHTHPDGREVYTINGIEQTPQRDMNQRFIPPPPPDMPDDGYPPPPLISGPSAPPPPPHRHHPHEYDGPYNSSERDTNEFYYHSLRLIIDNLAGVYPDRHWDQDREHGFASDRELKKRWWHGRR